MAEAASQLNGMEQGSTETASPVTGLAPKTSLSIERKLPLIIGGLLLAVIVALSLAAYMEVRHAAMRSSRERLTVASTQLRDALVLQTRQLRAVSAAGVAGKSELVDFAAHPGDANRRARAMEAIRYQGPQPAQVLGSELRDDRGTVLLSTLPQSYASAAASVTDVVPRTEPGDSALFGRFRALRDTIIYPVASVVPGSNGSLYLVRWRRLSGGQRNRDALQEIIGPEASIFVGNADGSQWSDLLTATTGPSLDSSGPDGLYRYERGGTPYLGAAATIEGTPWVIAVDVPTDRVLQPVRDFLGKLALIALLALAAGLVAAWIMSRRITSPLRQLTSAANAIAHGEYDQPVRINRTDEFGVLGSAFSTMAAEVKHSRDELEHKVEERTRDLNQTLVQLHETQDALVRRERLAMLGQLASGVGHELRNPLGVMTNAVYYLRTVLAQQPENIHEYLGILTQQITLSEKIVGDLLDFARQKPPQRKPVPLREAVEAQVQRLGARDGVRIDVEVPDDLPVVLVDPIHLGQIVVNLLTNAVQAMDGSGEVTVRGSSAGNPRMVRLEISDTGPGVEPGNSDKIFEPLFTTKARGIGLGLAVSRQLARANGGDLTLAQEPGRRGATFCLTLPSQEEGTT